NRFDYLLWYARDLGLVKFRQPYLPKSHEDGTAATYTWVVDETGRYRGMSASEKSVWAIPEGYEAYKPDNITSQGNPLVEFAHEGKRYSRKSKTPPRGLMQLAKAGRIHVAKNSIQYRRKLSDFGVVQVSELSSDTGTGSFTDD